MGKDRKPLFKGGVMHASSEGRISELRSRIRHLEARIASQKRTITSLQAKLRERNLKRDQWYKGREALLREELARTTGAMYGWKQQSDLLRKERDELKKELIP